MRRIYNTVTWRRFRAVQLRQSPLCVLCLDRNVTRAAIDVDHIVPINDGGEPFDFANVRSLCHGCHSTVTRAAAAGKEVLFKGCDVKGYPLPGSGHWWTKR